MSAAPSRPYGSVETHTPGDVDRRRCRATGDGNVLGDSDEQQRAGKKTGRGVERQTRARRRVYVPRARREVRGPGARNGNKKEVGGRKGERRSARGGTRRPSRRDALRPSRARVSSPSEHPESRCRSSSQRPPTVHVHVRSRAVNNLYKPDGARLRRAPPTVTDAQRVSPVRGRVPRARGACTRALRSRAGRASGRRRSSSARR